MKQFIKIYKIGGHPIEESFYTTEVGTIQTDEISFATYDTFKAYPSEDDMYKKINLTSYSMFEFKDEKKEKIFRHNINYDNRLLLVLTSDAKKLL